MMSFEIRNGFEEPKKIQSDLMDDDLRQSLWNLHEAWFHEYQADRFDTGYKILKEWLDLYWIYFFKQPINRLNSVVYLNQKIDTVREKFYALSAARVYAFLEFTVKYLGTKMPNKLAMFKKSCDLILETENSAYRFFGNFLAPITSNIDIEEIELSLGVGDEAAQHIESALTLLSNKEKDQSRESIAQSMLAPEAIAKKITADPTATLSSLCNQAKILPSHPQFRQALFNLYNFTSGKDGYRHALTNESEPASRALARFMLVTCSAFVNLIRSDSEIVSQKQPEIVA